jgi:hypothetical protein
MPSSTTATIVSLTCSQPPVLNALGCAEGDPEAAHHRQGRAQVHQHRGASLLATAHVAGRALDDRVDAQEVQGCQHPAIHATKPMMWPIGSQLLAVMLMAPL